VGAGLSGGGDAAPSSMAKWMDILYLFYFSYLALQSCFLAWQNGWISYIYFIFLTWPYNLVS
jgi:hypothetical protein